MRCCRSNTCFAPWHATWTTRFQGQYLVVCVQINILFSNQDAFIEYSGAYNSEYSDKERDDGFKSRCNIISEITTTTEICSASDVCAGLGRRSNLWRSSGTKQSLSKASQHIPGKNTVWLIHERWLGTTVRRRWRQLFLRRGRPKHLCRSCFVRPPHPLMTVW